MPKKASVESKSEKKKLSLAQLAKVLKKNLEIKDRTYHFKLFRQCFVGKEAVTWMTSEGPARDRKHAVDLLNKLLRLGVIEHVVKEHNFKDAYLFYRINEQKIPAKDSEQEKQPSSGKIDVLNKYAKQLKILETRRVQEMERSDFAKARKVEEQIQWLKEQIDEAKGSPGTPIIGPDMMRAFSKSNPQDFSPTDFFSLSPEIKTAPLARSSATRTAPVEITTGSRLEITERNGKDKVMATAVRKLGPTEWYILYDDGRCEKHDIRQLNCRILYVGKIHLPENRTFRKDSDAHASVASITSSIHDFSLGERELGKSTDHQIRSRSGRFSSKSSFLTNEHFPNKLFPADTSPPITNDPFRIGANDDLLFGGLNPVDPENSDNTPKLNVMEFPMMNSVTASMDTKGSMSSKKSSVEKQLDRLAELQHVDFK
eukprot:CAMPEP_0167761754 /NCGR_PEP_ID=MMETSP0110_2-20121227/12357_1 /TAXON_ID=629695 /ORGANISM="Gymnochlora sp., Strain CCMP2014" /LENGTH=427 /DNA_ID=CAMNT_0007648491 /DNA_START=144 /DNA_END=1427 /DNA_ORIENTATION=-